MISTERDRWYVERGAEMGKRLRSGLEELRQRRPSTDIVCADGTQVIPEDH